MHAWYTPILYPNDYYYARRSYASAILGVVILSVCLSVCLSHTCFVTYWKNLPAIFLYHVSERAILLVFCHPTVAGGQRPLPPIMGDRSDPPAFKNCSRRQISACNASTLSASEKSSIMTNRKSYTGFPTSYRWSAYVTSKSPKGWLKKRTFPFWSKSQFQLNEVCYRVSLRENFQRQSCSTLIALYNST